VFTVRTVLSFAFVLGVLVFVHELGHFLMARRIGVRVLTFSLGFGPKLLKVRRGDTEYCLSAIPLGGYVKMAGEKPGDVLTGASDEYLSKTKWQRFQVLVMGPVMNLALAVVVMAGVLYHGTTVPLYAELPVVVGTFAGDSVAQVAGIRRGDEVVSIDGQPVANWDQFATVIAAKAKRSVAIGVQRDGRRIDVQVVPLSKGRYETGDIGIRPLVRPEVEAVEPGTPAAEAGLMPHDVILAAGEQDGISYAGLLTLIRNSDGRPLVLQIERRQAVRTITVTPRLLGSTVRIGATINEFEVRRVNPGLVGAFGLSLQRNWEWAAQIVETLGGLVTGQTSIRSLMGPIGIAAATGDAVQQGWISLFTLMALISLNLGVFNLMPIPVLDGGHIAILAMEGLSRRDFSMKVKEKMLLAGFVLLLMLMVTVIYNDLTRVQWFEKLMPWR
jgi:regulator of sigma E protease